MMTTLRLIAGTLVLLTAAVQQTKAQTPTASLTGQDLVWATIAYRTVANAFRTQELAMTPRIMKAMMIDNEAAKLRAQKAVQQDMPDANRLKAWGEALAKQVSQNPPSDTNATAGALEILQRANELLKDVKDYRDLLDK